LVRQFDVSEISGSVRINEMILFWKGMASNLFLKITLFL